MGGSRQGAGACAPYVRPGKDGGARPLGRPAPWRCQWHAWSSSSGRVCGTRGATNCPVGGTKARPWSCLKKKSYMYDVLNEVYQKITISNTRTNQTRPCRAAAAAPEPSKAGGRAACGSSSHAPAPPPMHGGCPCPAGAGAPKLSLFPFLSHAIASAPMRRRRASRRARVGMGLGAGAAGAGAGARTLGLVADPDEAARVLLLGVRDVMVDQPTARLAEAKGGAAS